MIFRIDPSLIAAGVAFMVIVWLLLWNIIQGYRMNYLQAEITRLRGRILALEAHSLPMVSAPSNFLQTPVMAPQALPSEVNTPIQASLL